MILLVHWLALLARVEKVKQVDARWFERDDIVGVLVGVAWLVGVRVEFFCEDAQKRVEIGKKDDAGWFERDDVVGVLLGVGWLVGVRVDLVFEDVFCRWRV